MKQKNKYQSLITRIQKIDNIEILKTVLTDIVNEIKELSEKDDGFIDYDWEEVGD